jgi:hypothetical protein
MQFPAHCPLCNDTQTCSRNADCLSQNCDATSGTARCGNSSGIIACAPSCALGEPCNDPGDCASGECNLQLQQCSLPCTATGTCANYKPCTCHDQCASGYCHPSMTTCMGRGSQGPKAFSEACSTNDECLSGTCTGGSCARFSTDCTYCAEDVDCWEAMGQVCTEGACITSCSTDDDCLQIARDECNQGTGICSLRCNNGVKDGMETGG